ncbi:MAG: hypothetical protein SGPRY_002950 [Prymnesium sp.]
MARTETTTKRPSSASNNSELSSINSSAVSAAIRASSPKYQPSPPAANSSTAPATSARKPGAGKASIAAPAALAATAAAVASTDTKELSFNFLRNKRDAKGRKEGEPGYDKSTLLVKLTGDERFTPGQQQYWDIKKSYNDVIIFFKMGKFYELFEEDALIGHRELDLAFMGKGSPHAGFPEAALGKYAEKLVSLGYKVGVVEQMETPQQLEERNKSAGKGQRDKAVRRELCSVLTKGVAFHREDAATYLLSVCEDESSGTLGVCFVDAASGKFAMGQCMEDASKNRLHTLLAQLRPSEIVIDESRISRSAFTMLRRAVPQNLFNAMPRSAFWDSEKADSLQSSPIAVAAFGGCMSYLRKLLLDKQLLSLGAVDLWQPSDFSTQASRDLHFGMANQLTPPKYDMKQERHLILDAKALDNLEVFENSSDKGTKGTLFSVVDMCASPFGKRMLRSWLCRPPAGIDEICERQQTELRKLPDLERLIATINAFSISQAICMSIYPSGVAHHSQNYLATHATNTAHVSRCALVSRARQMAEEYSESAPLLVQALTKGDGFPAIDVELSNLRDTFDWQAAKLEGRVVPKPGADEEYDAAKALAEAATDRLEEIRVEWQSHFSDRSIEYWMPAGSTTEPFQLVVSEDTLKRKGTPDEFTLMSQKKGWRRFWDDDIREQAMMGEKEHVCR